MSEESFSPQQSLQLIRSMIDRTRQGISDNAHYYLVWGWLVFIACIGQFVLKHIFHYPKHYLVWLLMFVGVAYSIISGMRENKSEKVRTYVGESMKYLWSGMSIAYIVLSMVLTKIGWGTNVFPFFIILYGLGTFVSGSFIRFRPLIIGGVVASALAVVAVYVNYDYQMLVAAAAILVSYIIPAHLLKIQKTTAF